MENEMNVNFDELMNSGNGGNKFAPEFSDGVYVGMVIGATREHTEYEGVTKVKDYLVVQTYDDKGVAQTLKTGGYVPSLNDKSNCYKLLSGLTKEQDPLKMKDKLIAQGIVKDGQFSFANFLGKTFNFLVTMTPSKSGKLFPKITGIMLAKANQTHELKLDVKIPWFMVEDVIASKLMDGVEVFYQKDKASELDDFTKSLQDDLA